MTTSSRYLNGVSAVHRPRPVPSHRPKRKASAAQSGCKAGFSIAAVSRTRGPPHADLHGLCSPPPALAVTIAATPLGTDPHGQHAAVAGGRARQDLLFR